MEYKVNKDKWAHLCVCLLSAIVSPWLAAGLAIGKEYGDSKAHGNHWCWGDILADVVGVVVGSLIHWAIW